jgi:hypothetical protein
MNYPTSPSINYIQVEYNFEKTDGVLSDAQWQELEQGFLEKGINIRVERIVNGFIVFLDDLYPDLLQIPKKVFKILDPSHLPEFYAKIYFSNKKETIFVESYKQNMGIIFNVLMDYINHEKMKK